MEDTGMKQRLVGAVVLVILGVIVIPMLLGGEGHAPLTESNIPAPPESEFSSKIVPLDEVPPTGTLNPVPLDQPVPPPAAPAPSAPAPVQQAPAKKPAAAKAAVPARSAEKQQPVGAGWVVRLGSFANEQNARALRDQLQSKGYKPVVEKISASGTPLLRISVGPEADRARAEAIRVRLEKELKLKGKVIQYP